MSDQNEAARSRTVVLTKAQLKKAAKLRAEGATWNAIREATGTRLGSSSWFRRWEEAGIDHIPAHGRRKSAAQTEAER